VDHADLIFNDINNADVVSRYKKANSKAKSVLTDSRPVPGNGYCVECNYTIVTLRLTAIDDGLAVQMTEFLKTLIRLGRDAAAAILADRYGIPLAEALAMYDELVKNWMPR
jgi:hypothetical protein